MSDANREQVTSYLNSIWNNFVKDVSDSRKLPVDTLQALADRFMAMQAPEDAVKSEMIDTLVYIDGAKVTLKAYAGLKEKEKLNLLSVSDVCQLDDPKAKDSKNKVAVYYAAGSIVDEVASGYSTEAQIVGSKVVEDLQVLEDDENVKAVVLRINSGGGSAYASEQMWHAIKKLDKKKPVIVSMGGMAASGGYYMSSASQYIFAEPTTITGSIGIFGIIPDASELLTQKLGLKFDNVKTNKLADFGSTGRPFNAEESALLQKRIEAGYALFLKRVSMGRNKTPEQVNEIGQGRVWTGEQALEIGLVDKLGTLDEAIEYAAKKAKIEKEYKVTEYPEAEPWYMTILNKEKSSYYESQLRETLGEYFEPFMMLKNIKNSNPIQARMPYYPNIK
jgi:protease-4